MSVIIQLKETFCDNFINSYRVHSCHFNITGETFYQLHKLFQKIYEDSEAIQDDLGELLRALEVIAPETINEILMFADLEDTSLSGGDWQDLVQLVLDGQEHMINSYRKLMLTADADGEQDIANFAQDRIRQHKKYAWQLRSTLE
jgi:starvation-inducible DNA-binding protein